MTHQATLFAQLYGYLRASHEPLGQKLEQIRPEDYPDSVAYRVGARGVLAFIGEYALCGWDIHDMPAAPVGAYRVLYRRLRERGATRHMVYPLNFASVILTRKLGAKPLGVDEDGYVHYKLTLADFLAAGHQQHRHEGSSNGQEVATAEGP